MYCLWQHYVPFVNKWHYVPPIGGIFLGYLIYIKLSCASVSLRLLNIYPRYAFAFARVLRLLTCHWQLGLNSSPISFLAKTSNSYSIALLINAKFKILIALR